MRVMVLDVVLLGGLGDGDENRSFAGLCNLLVM